jgi:hypothetical protein
MAQSTQPQQFHPNPHFNQVRVASALNFLAGIYVLISAWLGAVNVGNRLNGIIGGAVVAILLGVWSAVASRTGRPEVIR